MSNSELNTPRIIYIIQVGTPPDEVRSLQGDVSDWFESALSGYSNHIKIIRAFKNEALPELNSKNIAVITGSWAMVTDHESWSENTAEWIRKAFAINMPLLGICYGHQLMAYALGGQVDYHPNGVEIGCKEIKLSLLSSDTEPSFNDLPASFPAYLSHRQTVTKLPKGAKILATSNHDKHQMVRYSPTAVSTQFHPEFTYNIVNTLIHFEQKQLKEEGVNVNLLFEDLKSSTPEARKILINLINIWLARLE